MGRDVIVDAGVLYALVVKRDRHHGWAVSQSRMWAPPWLTCEAALSEAFFLGRARARDAISTLLRRGAVEVRFTLAEEIERVLALMARYGQVPMSLADACIVRMAEIAADPVVLTTDSDFHIYRRHGRQVIPCVTPA
jgi:uncharacterized protein